LIRRPVTGAAVLHTIEGPVMGKKDSISFKNIIHGICLILFVLPYISCPTENEPEPDERAAINFFNGNCSRSSCIKSVKHGKRETWKGKSYKN
jgi:hypothetical protein